MKLLLYLYEQLSCLKINFEKSEVLMISQDEGKSLRYAELFNCAVGQWPMKYLGVPVCGSRLHIKDWLPLDEKLTKRLGGWQGNSLSFGGRLTLLNSCLSSIPIYSMSLYMLPKTIHKRLDKTRKHFFWQGGGIKKKYYLVKWTKAARPKNKGGLGIQDLWKLNISLLCKWWWKLEACQGIWQTIVMKKYVKDKNIAQLKVKPVNSPVWNDLLKIKDIYLKGRVMCVGNGQFTDFWRDSWCGMISLKEKFPDLFDICNETTGSVALFANRGWNLSFRRWLDERQQESVRKLRDMLAPCALSSERDYPKWLGERDGKFSVKSQYASIWAADTEDKNKNLWKAKIPLKIKVFMWLVKSNAILTKDNLSKKGWQGDQTCSFCSTPETIEHLFFGCAMARYCWSLVSIVIGADCRPSSFSQFWVWAAKYMPHHKKIFMVGLAAICWALWRTRNSICFEDKKCRSPTEIICLASSFLSYWAGLQKPQGKLELMMGAEALKNTALSFHPQEAPPEDAGLVLLR